MESPYRVNLYLPYLRTTYNKHIIYILNITVDTMPKRIQKDNDVAYQFLY